MALTAGYTQACSPNAGGVRRVALASRADVSTWVVDVNGQVTGITMVATKKFYEFEAELETIEFTENGSFANKTTLFEQSINMTWLPYGSTARKALLELYNESPCGMVCIHLEETGTAFIWGILPSDVAEDKKFVVRMNTSTRTTGRALNDSAQVELVLSARNIVPAAVFTPGWAGVPLT
jgi:hypothetical protein